MSARGQASVEVIGAAVALALAGLAVFQLLVAGRAAAIADGAAEAAAIAVVNGQDPEAAARAAAPGWARSQVHVREIDGRVRVAFRAPAILRVMPGAPRISAEAAVRKPAAASP